MDRGECEARVGTTLCGKWKLERLLGVGGMAAVYVARHKIGRDAAIKVLHPEIAVDGGVRERFEQEALAVNSIGHPGVVQILDMDETEDGCPFLVMELLDGETLADRAERQAPPLKQLLDIVDQLLDVLAACHKKGIIHRDIKPENLFIQRDGKLKVLDFGIARMREGVRTVAGAMLGTVAFMPPEQLKGDDIDGRADIFAIGATMFTVLAGRRVHLVDSDSQLAMKMLTTPAPGLASVVPDVPAGVAMVVDRALAYLADRRYPDAQTMRGDVWALQRDGQPPYARACIAAELDPHVVKLPPKEAGSNKPRTTGELPATDPQLPPFASMMPATDPQLPVFGDAPEIGKLPDTAPDGAIELEPEVTDKKWPPKEDEADAPLSDPPPSEPPMAEPPDVDPAAVVKQRSKRGMTGVMWFVVLLALAAGAAFWTGVIP